MQQSTERYRDKDIPVLGAVDVSFFVYLMKKIDPDCPAIKLFRDSRNLIAHMTVSEMDEFDFHDHFQMIIEAVNIGFKGKPEPWHKWRSTLEQIHTDDISDFEHLQPQFQVHFRFDYEKPLQKRPEFSYKILWGHGWEVRSPNNLIKVKEST